MEKIVQLISISALVLPLAVYFSYLYFKDHSKQELEDETRTLPPLLGVVYPNDEGSIN